jgi:hypothetical protein
MHEAIPIKYGFPPKYDSHVCPGLSCAAIKNCKIESKPPSQEERDGVVSKCSRLGHFATHKPAVAGKETI